MPIPPNAFQWAQPMDPADEIDYLVDVAGLLDVGGGETIASYTLTLGPEAVALGLTVGSGAYAPTKPTATSFKIWFSINSAFQANAAFDGQGALLPMTLTITTNSGPARIRQRTLVLQVAQQ